MMYRYEDQYGNSVILSEHLLYPTEIAKIYHISNDNGKPDGKAVKKEIMNYLAAEGIKEEYYFNGRHGKYRCFPSAHFMPAVKTLKGGRRMGNPVNKTCPHCGAGMFMGIVTKPIVVEVRDTEDENEKYNILKTSDKGSEVKILKCARCKRNIDESELVTGVACKECGRIVSPADLNDEGICDVCLAKKERADLANATQDELIHMLLKLEAMNSRSIKNAMKQQTEGAEEEQEPTANEEPAEEAEEKKPKTRKKRNVKKAEKAQEEETAGPADVPNAAESVQEEEQQAEAVTQEEVADAVEDIANSQEAPFPEVNMPLPMDEQQPLPVLPMPENNTGIGAGSAGFQMFDNGDGPAF